MRARIFWIFFYYLVRPMYTSAWKIRSRNDSLERERMTKEEIWTHTRKLFFGLFMLICLNWFESWKKVYLEKTKISNRLKSWMCGSLNRRDDESSEQNQLKNQQIWNTNKSWTRKSWTTNVYICLFFLITKTNSTRVGVFEMCWDDRINIVYLKLEILVFYSAFLCFYHVFPFGSWPRCTVSTCFIGRGW